MTSVRTVKVKAPDNAGYRVRIVGSSPDEVNKLLFGPRATLKELKLSPGSKTAFVESLSTNARFTQQFVVEEGTSTDTVALNWPPADHGWASRNESPLRGSASDGFLSTAAGSGREPKRFTLGLSYKYASNDRWKPANQLRVSELRQPAPDSFLLEIEWPDPLPYFPRVTITLAVEGHPNVEARLPLFVDGTRCILSVVEAESGLNVALDLRPSRSDTALLVEGLRTLSPDEAGALIPQLTNARGNEPAVPEPWEFAQGDPWATVAAILLTMQSGTYGNELPEISKLSDSFRWFPDLYVALAWKRALVAKEHSTQLDMACLADLKRARSSGVPFYALAYSMAEDLLGVMARSEARRVRDAASDERARWNFGQKADSASPILLLRSNDSWGRGTLSKRYQTVLAGRVSAAGLKLASS